MDDKDTCESCMFARPLTTPQVGGVTPSLQCQFFPPQVNLVASSTPLGQPQLTTIAAWPTVSKGAWCGQHTKAVVDGGPAVHRTGVSRLV